jgi:competence protein ComEA
MPTDERPSARPAPIGFREWLVASVRSRVPWLPPPLADRSFVRSQIAKVLAIVLVGALILGAWLVLRPASRPNIATLLPRAGASLASGGTAAGAEASGETGATALATTNVSGASGGSGAATILVHVVGAVVSPGVVRVPTGARVLDAVAAAGGPALDADLARVNLAAKLFDGQRVAVPRAGEVAPAVVDGGGGAADGSAAAEVAGPVDLNNATAVQLDTLPGVGPATAAAIIAYRTQHGPFRTVDALGDVKGIGPARLEQLRPLVTV